MNERAKHLHPSGPAGLRAIVWIWAIGATAWVWTSAAVKPTVRPLPDGVAVVRDLPYRRDGGRRLALDLYLPSASPSASRPVILGIHGGSWIGGSRREYGAQLARFAQHGFVVAAVDYQLARPGVPGWDGALEDVGTAVDWLADHALAFQIDPTRIIALGTSAGGLLAAHLARDDLAARGGSRSRRRIQAAVCLSTPYALDALAADRGFLKHDPIDAFLGGDPRELAARARDASAISHVSPGWRPILMIHGVEDLWVSVDQAREMRAICVSMGVRNRLIEVEGARHGFELQVGAPAPRDLLPDVLDFLRQAE